MHQRMVDRLARKTEEEVATLRQRLVALHLEQHALTEQLIELCGSEHAARVLIAAYDTARLATTPTHAHEPR